MKWHLLHPAAVHFPIALLIAGFAATLAGARSRRSSFVDAGTWLLWAGTLAAWAALVLGYLAEGSAQHVPPAWEVLADHKELAWWTAGVFSVLSLWRLFLPARWKRLYLIGWLVGVALLLATAYHGGELVYEFGMGVGR